MTRQRTAASICLVLLALFLPASLDAQRPTPESSGILRRWVEAVNRHRAGYPDEAVRVVATMSYAARRELNPAYALFIRVLRGEVLPVRDGIERDVFDLGRATRAETGWAVFLRRAAVLHADGVVFASRFPEPPDDPPYTPEPETSPLLTNERVALTQDAQVIGTALVNWNLPFARSLLDVLLKQPSRDDREFVGDWYHAVAAYLFSKGMFADATRHLQDAARVLPADPRIAFDRATYAEAFGLPIYQSIENEQVPSREKTNAEAEQLYRRTLDLDPSHVEARVRLARLLEHRRRYDEAAAEIDKALAAHPLDVTGFYARIVAGRIAAARGRYDEALRLYREASRMYAGAQSALLGASHSALMLADVPSAMAPLAHLPGERARPGDPWQDYRFGAGRDAGDLLAALWERAAQ